MVGADQDRTLVKIQGGRFSHGKTLIFSRVNLGVKTGEIFCLLGPNGCGKTTLLDCLLGINTLDAGDIFINGSAVATLSSSRLARQIAYVPQAHTPSFSFSVMDILLMGRTPYTAFYTAPGPEDRDRAEALLASLNLSHLKDRDYTQLSGGEIRLIMILRALVQETPVIIMDEPTAHLDFKNELMVLETISGLIKARGLTLIMATHFPNHAFYFENAGLPVRVGFMNHGHIHIAGPPSRALTPENLEIYYGVKTAVVAYDLPGRAPIRHVIPISTRDNQS